MSCFHPLKAYQTLSGTIVFNDLQDARPINLPCGQCIGCRIDRSRAWAMRCVHQASMYPDNCFVTLTYAPEYLPYNGSLVHRDFQLFMKRLRKKYSKKKFSFTSVVSTVTKITGHIITPFSLIITLMTGFICLIQNPVHLFIHRQLLNHFGVKVS